MEFVANKASNWHTECIYINCFLLFLCYIFHVYTFLSFGCAIADKERNFIAIYYRLLWNESSLDKFVIHNLVQISVQYINEIMCIICQHFYFSITNCANCFVNPSRCWSMLFFIYWFLTGLVRQLNYSSHILVQLIGNMILLASTCISIDLVVFANPMCSPMNLLSGKNNRIFSRSTMLKND